MAQSFDRLINRGIKAASLLSNDKTDLQVSGFLNLRYQGQSYELCIPYEKNFIELFHQEHEHRFGYRIEDKPLELVSIQCSIRVKKDKIPLPRKSSTGPKPVVPIQDTLIQFEGGTASVPVYNRKSFITGQQISGPALVVDDYITVLLTEEYGLQVDTLLNLILERKG